MSSDVIGQLVTPQNSEIMPTAVHSDGSKPVRLPNRHPKVAPMKKDGTISPPLKPAPRVSAVKMIFSRNASGLTEPSILLWMTLIPVPLYVWFPTSIVAMMTKQPPMNTLVYLFGRYFCTAPHLSEGPHKRVCLRVRTVLQAQIFLLSLK